MILCKRKVEILVLVQGANLIDSLIDNGTKYLLTFHDSCERTCISEAFVDIAATGTHCGLSSVYIKHNLFQQIKSRAIC